MNDLILNSNNVKYNHDTDTIQVYYNEIWNDIIPANLQAYYLFKSGAGLQNDVKVSAVSGYGTLTTSDEKIHCIGGAYNYSDVTFSKDCTEFVGQGKKLYMEVMCTTAIGQDVYLGFCTSFGSSSYNAKKLDNIPLNTLTTLSINIDDYYTSSYKFPFISLNTNIDIYNVYIK